MSGLMTGLRRALEDWDVVGAQAEINKPENRAYLEQNSLDVIPLICEYLTPELEESGPHLTQCCQDLILTVSQVGSAKENLIALLEQIDGFRSVVLVKRVLPGLGVILLKIKDKSKSHSWDWALDTVACHLKTIPYPSNTGLEGKERLTLDLSPEAVDSIELLDELVTFLQPLVNFTLESEASRENEHRQAALKKFVLQAVGHPLACLSQHPELSTYTSKGKRATNTVLPRSHHAASKLVEFVSLLSHDHGLQVVLQDSTLSKDTTMVSLGNYLYLVFAEGMQIDYVPQVYSHLFHLCLASRYIRTMLSSEWEMIVFKAVLLLSSILKRIPVGWLDGDSGANPELQVIIDPLVKVIIYSSTAEVRELSFQCYKKLLQLFDVNAKYSLYKCLFNTLNHSGILGWTVTQLKDTLAYICRQPPDNYPNFKGDSLMLLIAKLFYLKHGVQTDLLEISDELIAEINLGYFLLFRCSDLQIDESEFKSKLKGWADDIQKGVELSRAHWQLKLKSDSEQHQSAQLVQPECSVMVGGEQLPTMDPQQTRQMVKSALNTFDVIQFNLSTLIGKLG